MKLLPFLATASLALAALPVAAQDAAQQRFDWQAQEQAYGNRQPPNFGRCFNGKFIAGANRSGANSLYVQSYSGDIYGVKVGEVCDALNSADKISLRSNGSDRICASQSADLIVQTATGSKRCHVSVRQLSSREVAALAASRP